MSKKTSILIYPIVYFGMILVMLNGCSKEDEIDENNNTPPPTTEIPVISTTVVININATIATCGGHITNDGGEAVTERGVCWSTNQNPTLDNHKTIDGVAVGVFVSNIENLQPETIYFIRAYATNTVGTAYGDEQTFTTLEGVTDVNGNNYNTVTIGSQKWMAENLKTTTYNDGTEIPLVIDNDTWRELTSAAYCWYENDASTNKKTYGAIYNWYTVENGNLCPTGWHVPSDDEWTILTDYLGGDTVAGNKLKEAGSEHWPPPNSGATNSSGFTGLPGGFRVNTGDFDYINTHGFWWSATENGNYKAKYRELKYTSSELVNDDIFKELGFSIRCLKD